MVAMLSMFDAKDVAFLLLSILSLNRGRNDAVRAPSPKTRLERFGKASAVKKADMILLVPKK